MNWQRTLNPARHGRAAASAVILVVLALSASASGQLIVVNQEWVPGESRVYEGRITVFDRAGDGDVAPVRVIEGPSTELEGPFAAAVDLEQQELFVLTGLGYVVNVYGLLDQGDASPKRTITRAGGFYTPFSIAVDQLHHELFVFDDGTRVWVFDSSASGAVEPVRVLNTHLDDTGFIAVDLVHDELFLQCQSLIRVFARTAAGDDLPLREIFGSNTGMNGRYSLAIDTEHDEIIAAGAHSIRVFPRTGDGNVAPLRVIEGPDTGLSSTLYGVAYDPSWRTIFVTSQQDDTVLSFARDAEGSVPPLRTIVGGKTGLNEPAGIVVLGLVFVNGFEEGNATGWDGSVS